ncbi:hypothetical protein [Polluticaenibacter yanchengensis]|uniref:Uncharacterized protein n=1 Tax=Polluticaenibacter yanchengensis TaxID=3014562 RepID=A0ABT4UG58_9BACT|nr:hypothetical protein [Chitinophagaceae bacterium LY-5]
MVIIYQNEQEIEVSLEETNTLNTYFKLFFENEVLLKKEEFKNHNLEYIYHYKQNGETTEAACSVYKGSDTRFSIITQSVLNDRTLELWQDFDGGDLIFTYHILYDFNNHCICKEYIDLETGKPVYEETEKYYYKDSSSDLDYIIKASYHSDASLNNLFYFKSVNDQFTDIEYNTEDDLVNLATELGIDYSELKYYHNAFL